MQEPSTEQDHEEPATPVAVVPVGSSPAHMPAAPLASLPSLPIECLQLILAHHDGDLTTLHALLLVNRTFFQLAVPLLYRSPFRLVRSYEHDKLPWDKFKRQVKLLWLLLCSVIHQPWVRDELPPFSAEFPLLHNPTRNRLCSDGEDRHDLQESLEAATRGWPTGRLVGVTAPDRDLTIDYLRYYTHHDHTTLSDAFPTLFPSLICYHMDQWSNSEDMIRIRNTVERALLLHHAEGIVTLAAPITRIHLFLEAVPRLLRLRRIELHDIKLEFKADDAIEFVRRHDQITSGQQSQQGHRGSVFREYGPIEQGAMKSGTSEHGASATAAEPNDIQDHSVVSLTEVKIGGPGDYGIIEKPDLYRILQAMSQPKVIDLTGWRGAVLDLAQVPVHSLETLLMRLDRPLPKACPVETFLQRARNLKNLQICISPVHGGIFRWAVQWRNEKNSIAHRRLEQEVASASVPQDLDKIWPGVNERQEELGLKTLSLAGETTATVWALTGATEAFSRTLEVLKANSWKRPVGIPLDDFEDDPVIDEPPYPIGALAMGDTDRAAGADANIPTHHHFHPHHTSVHSSLHSPQLSWASFMPRLQELDLKGEVAAIAFDFRSLARCPQLRILRLNTHPCGVAPNPERIRSLLQYVSVSLQELDLTGPWFITDWHLNQMATVALPDLRRLRLVHCRTFSDLGASPEQPPSTTAQTTVMMRTPLPPHLVDVLPAQQDILLPDSVSSSLPWSSPPSSSTSSPSSSSLCSSESAAAAPSISLSTEYLTGPGLVHAVEQMKELREIQLGLDLGRREPHDQRQGQGQRDRPQRSPYEELMAAQAAAGAAGASWSSASSSTKTSPHGMKGNQSQEEGELAAMARALKHHSENRILPLKIEIQHCSV
ncbi:hypothetical protein BGZ70_007672 [Mortierella alpina]|uniref:Uncharacterized protein n=1 Tax=Mortierella alpina TaxID=64518 RepID=A0A9P6JFQ2_MORAP|nr:hypothetical protein BGZ70_007672 [Mortierella alpina]